MDNPRDMLHMINHFRKEMPQPLVGIGHSFGGNNLVNVSLMHPRLFATHVLLDPVIAGPPSSTGGGLTQASTFRRDLWPSREEAIAGFKKSPFYQAWDPRVLDSWNQYGIRKTPTAVYPDVKDSVTLTTTKHQEVFTFLRPLYPDPNDAPFDEVTKISHPDVDPIILASHNFYSPAPFNTLSQLKHLRPSVLYVFGGISNMSSPALTAQKLALTGTGTGGSGGAKLGRVKEVTLPGIGHLIPMEVPVMTGENAAQWIGAQMEVWRAEAEKYAQWKKKDALSRQTVSEEWKKRIGGDLRARKDSPAKL